MPREENNGHVPCGLLRGCGANYNELASALRWRGVFVRVYAGLGAGARHGGGGGVCGRGGYRRWALPVTIEFASDPRGFE